MRGKPFWVKDPTFQKHRFIVLSNSQIYSYNTIARSKPLHGDLHLVPSREKNSISPHTIPMCYEIHTKFTNVTRKNYHNKHLKFYKQQTIITTIIPSHS